MEKLYLVDGMSLVFRAFHAMYRSGLSSPDGMPTGAIFGFTNIITKLLETENPENLVVVFDTSAPTFRHEMFDDYKANRVEFPEELVPQLPKIKELLSHLSIPQYEKDGYEADDIIGTLAKRASKKNIKVFCLTSDKDFMQLVDDNIKLLKPASKGEDLQVVDYPEVKEKFGVTPTQVIDVQALTGDSVDNIPGVKGVGEKTAGPLIDKYGSLENLYEHLDEIDKKALKSKLETDKEMAFLSKMLVTIKVDCEIDFTIDDSKLKEVDYHNLDRFFQEVGFTTLRRKWQEKAVQNNAKIEFDNRLVVEELDDKKVDYHLINEEKDLEKLIEKLEKSKEISFDLETDSLDTMSCNIVGVALSVKENEAYYISTNPSTQSEDLFSEKKTFKSLDIDFVAEKIRPVLENTEINKIGQNTKFDALILKRFGINVHPISFDTMLASYVLNPDDKHNMDDLSVKWLNYKPVKITSLIGENKKTQITMAEIDPAEIKDYACEDADVTLKLKNRLEKEIEKENLQKLAYDIEFPVVEVLTDIEYNGIKVDQLILKEIEEELNIESAKLKEEIFGICGFDFNLDSPKQLGEVLFEKMGIPPVKKTKTGYSTDNQVLTELSHEHEIAKKIVDYRSLTKLNSTYVTALPKLINKKTGRIHTTFNQTVASTGRLSSTNPNLQNIPIKTDYGKEIRKAFVAKDSNYEIMSADYSQIELRIMAYYSGDEHLINAFNEGIDIHSATASKLFGKKLSDVTQDDRRVAKTVNFGIMYGLGSFGLSQRLGISRAYSKEIIDNYFESYPGIKNFMDEIIESTRQKTYAETIYGRRRYFKNINSSNHNIRTQDERAAINLPIQGSASDMIKLAMISVHKYLKNNSNIDAKMILQVHDELLFEVNKKDLEELTINVKNLMQNALSLDKVPILVETGHGENWYLAH